MMNELRELRKEFKLNQEGASMLNDPSVSNFASTHRSINIVDGVGVKRLGSSRPLVKNTPRNNVSGKLDAGDYQTLSFTHNRR